MGQGVRIPSGVIQGFCRQCGRVHSLPGSPDAAAAAGALMDLLERHQRIDIFDGAAAARRCCRTQPLFGPARGQMFGVLSGRDRAGNPIVLRAFSGQFNGTWEVAGWVPPLFDTGKWHRLCAPVDARIKELGRLIDGLPPGNGDRQALRHQRRQLSQQLMTRIHALYRLRNFGGRQVGLVDLFPDKVGIANGTGDCCAPKLLHYAAGAGITPTGVVEFFWGRENRSGSRKHRGWYAPCTEKCGPILGFLLCGLEQ